MREGDNPYGDFEIPSNAHIEVVGDPVKEALAQYHVWKQTVDMPDLFFSTCQKNYENIPTTPNVNSEQLEESIRRLAKRSITVEQIKDQTCAGLYTSALFNNSKLTLFTLNTPVYLFGYQLREGKTLVNRATINMLGPFAAGNTINYGTTNSQAHNARGGVHINFGTTHTFWNASEKGVYFSKNLFWRNHQRRETTQKERKLLRELRKIARTPDETINQYLERIRQW